MSHFLADFHFLRPGWLLVILPAIALWIWLWRKQARQGNWEVFCDDALLPFILEQKLGRASRYAYWLALPIILLSTLALAGPTWERLPAPVFRNTSALVIVLDLSISMDATDIKPSRLVRARYKISDLLHQRKDGQSALIVYAGDSFTVTPLTNDSETIDNQLSALSTDMMPSQGDRADLALARAESLLKQAGMQKGHVLLVSDHVDSKQVADTLKRMDAYPVSILALGTPEGGPIKAEQGDFVKDAQGNIVIPKLDLKELEEVSQKGQGLLVKLSDDNADIEQLSRFFEPQQDKQGMEDPGLQLQLWADQGPWLVVLLLPLAALLFRRGLLLWLIVMGLPHPREAQALEWKELWKTPDQQAMQAFQEKDYATAAEKFRNPAWQAAAQYKAGNFEASLKSLDKPQSADDFYNQGNALAQSGKLAEAIKAYEQALKLKANDEDTLHNKKLVEEALKKQQEQQQKQQNQQSKNDQSSQEQDQSKQDQAKQEPSQQQDQQTSKDNKDQDASKSDQQQKKTEEPKDAAASPEKPEPKDNSQDQAQAAKPEEKQEDPAKPEDATQEQSASMKEMEEHEANQANEQWLKRIPDDPAGLLRRKFKYQYGQRRGTQTLPDDQ